MRKSVDEIKVEMTADDMEHLVALARYYETSMGFMRHVVKWTNGRETRERFRYVAQESTVLDVMATTVRDRMARGGKTRTNLDLTPKALVAFWGRALSSLRSKRARRKMSPDDLAARERVEAALRRAVQATYERRPSVIEAEISTRRTPEAEWMREILRG